MKGSRRSRAAAKEVASLQGEDRFSAGFGDRLSHVLDAFSSRAEAAAMAGVTADQFPKYVSGERSPRFVAIARLAHAKGFSIDWLWSGKGSPKAGDEPQPEPEEFVHVPMMEARVSSGLGSPFYQSAISDYVGLRRRFIREVLRTPEKNLCIIINSGKSNEPDLRDGDALLVDRGINALVDDAYYVFDREGALLVKKIERLVDGQVILKSGNPTYEPQRLSPEEAANLMVFGRVRWSSGLR